MSEERHRATSEAKEQVKARPATAPSREAGIARYLGAQHYRERRAHQESETAPAASEPERDEQPT